MSAAPSVRGHGDPASLQESKGRKGSSASKSRSQPALGPKKASLWSFSVPVLILASSTAAAAAAAASKLRAHSRHSSQRHVHQELFPFSVMGWEFRVLPEKVTSDQAILGAEVTVFHHRETVFHHAAPWQWVSARKTIRAALPDFGMSRTWCVPPPGASSWIGSQDGGLVFKGQTWHIMHQSSQSTEI